MDLDEPYILEALGQNRQDTFEKMFKICYSPLCSYAYSFLRSHEEAEETVQSVLINLWEKRSELNIETSLKSYLYRAVRNSCMNVLKHEKVKTEHVSYAMRNTTQSALPTQELIAVELEERIARALTKLPEQCGIVFKLSRFEELKYAEIAERLGISVKTVENQMGKALRIMREELKDYLPLLLILMKNFL